MKTGAMVAVGRPINGISVNGLEWLLGDAGDLKIFPTINEAKDFLKTHGVIDMANLVFWSEYV